jgi:hypothetical protein
MSTHTSIQSINVAVAEQIKAIGTSKAVEVVINQLAQKEIDKRSTALAAAIALADTVKKDIAKASKPDVVTVTTEGVTSESFSATAYEARKKLIERLEKIEKTVVAAIEGNDWGKLYDLVK